MRTVGFIGAGNMGGAILQGIINVGCVKAEQVYVYEQNAARVDELMQEMPYINYVDDVISLVQESDMIILAVKPYVLGSVLAEIRDEIEGKALVSIAAGWTCKMLEEALADTGATYLRVMPNTPALVGEGMTAVCTEHTLSKADYSFAKMLFAAIGKTAELPERLFDGAIAISGSSPAYVFMMLEAMADAGVREGLPRAQAYEMAAQAVLGSALMMLTTGEHPGALKDAVCSPGGTTIEAVEALERNGFRAAIMDAMHVCAEKSRAMSK